MKKPLTTTQSIIQTTWYIQSYRLSRTISLTEDHVLSLFLTMVNRSEKVDTICMELLEGLHLTSSLTFHSLFGHQTIH